MRCVKSPNDVQREYPTRRSPLSFRECLLTCEALTLSPRSISPNYRAPRVFFLKTSTSVSFYINWHMLREARIWISVGRLSAFCLRQSRIYIHSFCTGVIDTEVCGFITLYFTTDYKLLFYCVGLLRYRCQPGVNIPCFMCVCVFFFFLLRSPVVTERINRTGVVRL